MFAVCTIKSDAPRQVDPAGKMMPHQCAAVHAMRRLENSDRGPGGLYTRLGVLGDRPAAGKTFTVSGLVRTDGPVPSESLRVECITSVSHAVTAVRTNACDLTLVLVPHNLVLQWRAHLEAEGLVAPGSVAARRSDVPLVSEALASPEGRPRVLLVNATLADAVLERMEALGVRARRIVVDEADTIRMSVHFSSLVMLGSFLWLVTGSSHNLMCSQWLRGDSFRVQHAGGEEAVRVYGSAARCASGCIREALRPVGRVSPSSASGLFVICDNQFVDESLSIPVPETHSVPARASVPTRVFTGLLPETIMARLNNGDISGAVEALGAHGAASEAEVVSAAMRRLLRERNNLRLQLQFVEVRAYSSTEDGAAARARVSGLLEASERRIECARERIEETQSCMVCFDDLVNRTVVPCCQNSFCLGCIVRWLERSGRCPLCNQDISAPDLVVCSARPPGAAPPPAAGSSAGLVEVGGASFLADGTLEANLGRLGQHLRGRAAKCIVFSDNDFVLQHTAMAALQRTEGEVVWLKGPGSVINKRMRAFRDSATFSALLVNCSYYGCGMDLSFATDVVLLHAVPDTMRSQVIGRAQRPGRTAPLRIWAFGPR